MAPIHVNAEPVDADDEESYIEEEIVEDDEDEEVVEEEIIEDEETVEEELVDDDEEEEVVEDEEEEIVEDDEGSVSLDDDNSSAPDYRPAKPEKKSSNKREARSKLLEEIAAQRKLAENLKQQNSEGDLKRNQELAKLRRQAARDELARSNSKLKTGRITAPSIASVSTTSSFAEDTRKKGAVEQLHMPADVKKNINSVEIPQKQTPVSPLKSKDDSSRASKSSVNVASLKSKLKPSPFQTNRKSASSHSRVTDWIREDPMEKESHSDGALPAAENGKSSFASKQTKVTNATAPRPTKQLSAGSQRSAGQAGSESGSIPLKSRSNDMSISSKPNMEVDNYYSLSLIRSKSIEGIDTANLEKYLSPKDFEATFKMTKEAFYKLPRWKQNEAKKALKLF